MSTSDLHKIQLRSESEARRARKVKALARTFRYLDALRETGANMYGSASYVMRDLGHKRERAASEVVMWMKSFSKGDPEVRARAALALAEKAKP